MVTPEWIIATFAVLGAMGAIYKDYGNNRPKIKLKSLTLDTNRVYMYVGKNVNWDGREKGSIYNEIIKGSNLRYIDIVKETKRLRMNTKLEPNEHLLSKEKDTTYMFINLCTQEDIDSKSDNIVLAFGVLNITLDLSADKIRELKIARAYSMKEEDESYGKVIGIDVSHRGLGITSSFEMPVAYACVIDVDKEQKEKPDTSLYLKHISDKKTENDANGSHKPINFLEKQTNSAQYIGFIESAYLLECKIRSRLLPYYHSIFLNKANERVNSQEEDGIILFYKNAIKIWRRTRVWVVQGNTKNKL